MKRLRWTIFLTLALLGADARSASQTAAGGAFAVRGEVVAPSLPQGNGFVLRRAASSCASLSRLGASVSGSCGCFCSSLLFADGFESGDTGAWSTAVP